MIISATAAVAAYLVFFAGNTFVLFVIAQVLLGVAISFNSGTDTSLLYDTLRALGRTQDTAAHEAKSWRYTYVALALSAATGGIMASGIDGSSFAFTYLLTAVAGGLALALVCGFAEPTAGATQHKAAPPMLQFHRVVGRLGDPVLRWMFVFMISLYVLSHVPFVFVQPYLRELLAGAGLEHETPAVAGVIVAVMMGLSALLGAFVMQLRARFGTRAMFGVALALQAGLIAVMAWIVHPLIIAFIVLRMAPGALTRPFFLEAIHPRLESGYRATYLSVQSLVARLAFSGALLIVAASVSGTAVLDRAGLQSVLPWFALGGAVIGGLLWWAWPRAIDEASPVTSD